MPFFPRFFVGLVLTLRALSVFGAGNTTCAGTALDWYTTAVGETPCMTYQRLRQICNSEYEVPSFRPNTPGDNCNDQLSICCCNSISWALSMLCMNCQWDVNGGNVNGIDAGATAYYMYRANCGAGTNQSLPTNIQEAACNENIRLENFLYSLFWTDGSWYYTYTREAAQQQHSSDPNDFYQCSSSSSSKPSSSSTNVFPTASWSSGAQPTSTGVPPPSSGAPPSSLPGSAASTTTSGSGSSSSSFVTTFESQTTIDGVATSVPYVTTVVTTVPSPGVNGTAVGLGATGNSHKTSTGAIVGGAVGGLAALILLGVLGRWCTRRQRSADVAPVLYTQTGVAGPADGPASPNMVERNAVTPFFARESTGDPFASAAPAATTGKFARMHNSYAYAAPGSTSGSESGSSSGSGSGPTSAYGSQQALYPMHPPSGSTSSYSQADVAVPAMGPIVQEEDAGRLTGGGIRLPPAYQSEWNAE